MRTRWVSSSTVIHQQTSIQPSIQKAYIRFPSLTLQAIFFFSIFTSLVTRFQNRPQQEVYSSMIHLHANGIFHYFVLTTSEQPSARYRFPVQLNEIKCNFSFPLETCFYIFSPSGKKYKVLTALMDCVFSNENFYAPSWKNIKIISIVKTFRYSGSEKEEWASDYFLAHVLNTNEWTDSLLLLLWICINGKPLSSDHACSLHSQQDVKFSVCFIAFYSTHSLTHLSFPLKFLSLLIWYHNRHAMEFMKQHSVCTNIHEW